MKDAFPFSYTHPIDLQKDKHEIFYIHFNTFFERDEFRSYRNVSPEGNYVQNVICEMEAKDNRRVEVLWSIEKNAEGALQPIKFSTKTKNDLLLLKEKAIEEITEVLVSVINAKEETQFFREKYHYLGKPLHGEYYLPGFRIAPAYPMEEEYIEIYGQKLMNSTRREHVLYIDHEVSGFNTIHLNDKRTYNANLYSALMSLFLDVNLFVPTTQERWVMTYDTGKTTSHRLNLGYVDEKPIPNKMPEKGTESRAGETRPVDRTNVESDDPDCTYHLKCPRDIRKLIRSYNRDLSDGEKLKFFSAAKFYQMSLDIGERYNTAGMAYQISAIDILNSKHSAQEYKKLVHEYFPAKIDDEYVTYLYQNVRSAHFHEGKFPGGENEEFGEFSALIEPNDYPDLIRDTKIVCRNVLIQWLLTKSKENN